MGAIFYIGSVLTASPQSATVPIAPRTTKAQSMDYTKVIALNTAQSDQSGTANTLPDNTRSQNETPTPIDSNTPTPTLSLTPYMTQTPTEVILAYQTVTATVTPVASSTPLPTVATLPQTGAISSSIVLFGVAGITVFLSLLF